MGSHSIFLNVPFDRSYEPKFVTLVSTLVCLGQTPRCVVEIPEGGKGRLNRIYALLSSCRVSIHDLSRVGRPPRFNMPFELGLACALALGDKGHDVVVLDAAPHRLDKYLSDYKGRDPHIHNNCCDDLVTCVLDSLEVSSEPDPADLRRSAKWLRSRAREIARNLRTPTVFGRSAFRALAAAATEHAVASGYIEA